MVIGGKMKKLVSLLVLGVLFVSCGSGYMGCGKGCCEEGINCKCTGYPIQYQECHCTLPEQKVELYPICGTPLLRD